MKTLLQKIRLELQQALASYVREKDVFVLEDEQFLPDWVKMPAIGLMDGGTVWGEGSFGGQDIATLTVRAVAYVDVLRAEVPLMGDGLNKGVLEITEDIRAALVDNLLDDEVFDAIVTAETPSSVVGNESALMVKKAVILRYTRR